MNISRHPRKPWIARRIGAVVRRFRRWGASGGVTPPPPAPPPPRPVAEVNPVAPAVQPPLRVWRLDDFATFQAVGPALWRVFDAPRDCSPGETLRGYSISAEAFVDFEITGDGGVEWREGVWCPTTHLNSRMRAAYHLLATQGDVPPDVRLYCTEQVTPLYRFLKSRYPNTVGSEYLPDVERGETDANGVRSEDLTALTFSDAELDALLSLDVLEHIADHRAALKECARVLKPGGVLVLTAPFAWTRAHVVRAEVQADGSIRHLHPPEHHHDPLGRGALCYRYYGFDLLDELRDAGFTEAYVAAYNSQAYGYLGMVHSAVVARR